MLTSRLLAVAAALLTAVLLPLVLWQATRLRRRTLRLPAGEGPPAGTTAGAGEPAHLLVVGESPVAGVGVATQAESLSARLACRLGETLERPVRWRAVGRNGVTAARAGAELVTLLDAERVDLLVIALGVNDVVSWTTPGSWRRDLAALVRDLRARVGDVPVLIAGVPPVGRFPIIPAPLATVFGLRSGALERAAAVLADETPRARHVPFDVEAERSDFAEDGFHPSASGCDRWGTRLAAHAAALLDASRPGRPDATSGR